MQQRSAGWAVVLGLALTPAVSNGFSRFAYGLILPAMRTDLGWTYTQAGWMNTANSVGYLLGAMAAFRLIPRLGSRRLLVWGLTGTAVTLCASGMARGFGPQMVWRFTTGLASAPAFIAGTAMAAASFLPDARRNALAIGFYFAGGGGGILVTALALPPLLEVTGTGGWPFTWWALGLASAAALLPVAWAVRRAGYAAPVRARAALRLPWRAMTPSLLGYFGFAMGYIVYITFLIAWMRERGAGTGLVTATWAALGVGTMLSPFPWRGVLAAHATGRPLAYANAATGLGALLPFLVPTTWGAVVSAFVFGLSFFNAPASVTAFARKNLPQAQWGPAVAAYTFVFAIGQTFGPIGAGWLADAVGALAWGLVIAAGVLLASALIALFQPALASPVEEPTQEAARPAPRPVPRPASEVD